MYELNDFLDANPPTRKFRSFNEQELSELNRFNLPVEISEFLKTEGLATYRDDFFGTTLPQWHFDTISEWGLNGKQCFAFLKTTFGGLFFYKKGKIFRLNPFTGYVVESDFDFFTFMNLMLTSDSILESCYFDIYEKHKTGNQLQYDEIYALLPALPIGGSFETSKYEVVKMREHLGFLAQLFGNQVRKI